MHLGMHNQGVMSLENPEKTELIEFDSTEVLDESSDELPGFGILAAGASLLFVSRRFRN